MENARQVQGVRKAETRIAPFRQPPGLVFRNRDQRATGGRRSPRAVMISSSITMLSRVVTNALELRSAEGTEPAPSQQPGLDRAENLFPRRTKSFFCGASRRSG